MAEPAFAGVVSSSSQEEEEEQQEHGQEVVQMEMGARDSGNNVGAVYAHDSHEMMHDSPDDDDDDDDDDDLGNDGDDGSDDDFDIEQETQQQAAGAGAAGAGAAHDDNDDDGDDDGDEYEMKIISATRWVWVKKEKPKKPAPVKQAKRKGAKTKAAAAPARRGAGRQTASRAGSRTGGAGSSSARNARFATLSAEDEEARRGALGLRTRERKTYAEDANDDDLFETDDDDADDDADDDHVRAKKRSKPSARARATKADDPEAKAPVKLAVDFPDDNLIPREIDSIISHRKPGSTTEGGDDVSWESAEFRIKWRYRSYQHSEWVSHEELEHKQLPGFKKVANYIKRQKDRAYNRQYMTREEKEVDDVQVEMERQQIERFMTVDRVVSEDTVTGKLLCKWKALPYQECTWEWPEDIEEFLGEVDLFRDRAQEALQRGDTVGKARASYVAEMRQAKTKHLLHQPSTLKGGKLRDYQLDGLNWMIKTWSFNMNGILADEMGLGKTVQCVSMISWLQCERNVRGPFLVVVPLSTIDNWEREFKKWAPNVNTVTYIGSAQSRGVARSWEFHTRDFDASGKRRLQKKSQSGNGYMMNVLLTTYEIVMQDSTNLMSVPWAYLVVDEAHRLKNPESRLYQDLMKLHIDNKLLVTGTPLQNSIQELWALLHFIQPDKFDNLGTFEVKYNMQDQESIQELHETLRPHLIRRIVKDVEKSLPPKSERILRVEMTPLQKKYYKMILSRNFDALNKGVRGPQVTLLNVIMELKKCCNHPFLFESAEAEVFGGVDGSTSGYGDRVAMSSGKVNLLDQLLRRLKETGHRVLIFSQMVRMLDILEDYLSNRGWAHQRLDGSTSASRRKEAMEHFNAPGSEDFCFLLSTRAGGLGINLATADTVVLFDSDWNPQNDLQAMARAHRIGQTQSVNIYRFVTKDSVEEDIIERAKSKMVLDALVIQKMDASGGVGDPALEGGGGGGGGVSKKINANMPFDKKDLDQILKFGAQQLFAEEDAKAEGGDAAGDGANAAAASAAGALDLDEILSRAEQMNTTAADAVPDAAKELLGGFGNVSNFAHSAEDDAAFWEKLIPVQERIAAKEEEEQVLLPRQARMQQVNYNEGGGGLGAGSRPEGSDAIENALATVSAWPSVSAGGGGDTASAGASDAPQPAEVRRKDAAALVRAIKKFGRATGRWDDLAKEAGMPFNDPAVTASHGEVLMSALLGACAKALFSAVERSIEPKEALVNFFGHPVKAAEIHGRCDELDVLAEKVAKAEAKGSALTFRLAANEAVRTPPWGKAVDWKSNDDAMLLLGVHRYGFGAWTAVEQDDSLQLREKLSPTDDPMKGPKASQLDARAAALLRKLLAVKDMAAAAAERGGTKRKRAANKADGAEVGAPPPPPPPPSSSGGVGGGGSALHAAAAPAAAKPKKPRASGQGAVAGAATKKKQPPPPPPTAAAVPPPLDQATTDEAKQRMRPVKDTLQKLRELGRRDDLEPTFIQKKTKKYLMTCGQQVDNVLSQLRASGAPAHIEQLERAMWQYVASSVSFPGTNEEKGKKIQKKYLKFKRESSSL